MGIKLFSILYSDPHSVASLLVQQLLAHFSDTFLVSSSRSHDQVMLGEVGGTGGKLAKGSTLRDFLCDEVTLLLLISISLISKQVKRVMLVASIVQIYCLMTEAVLG